MLDVKVEWYKCLAVKVLMLVRDNWAKSKTVKSTSLKIFFGPKQGRRDQKSNSTVEINHPCLKISMIFDKMCMVLTVIHISQ